MSKIVIFSRKKIQWYAIAAAIVVLAAAYITWQQSRPASAPAPSATGEPRVIHLVTGEFSTTTEGGKKIESYRWDPGTVVAKKGEPLEIRISGVNGESHPFVIEGLNISGKVVKGKTTVIAFTPKEAGIYPIICQTHGADSSGGPMVGYLVVQ